ncbi:hypothetical protein WR25_10353 [Diploscapter pachys]|uniref:Uncharacterized protein n=1 Tax=Diploscapter pachys TaxID=2018661 RepID=A0A2A2M2B2_9BILA|nr:hypothetical protein WR25_10353 [Diploscapter pachys]
MPRLAFGIADGQAPGHAAQLRQARAGAGKVQGRCAAVCAGIEHAALGLQLLQVLGRAVASQISGGGAEHQALAAQVTVLDAWLPGLWSADAHDNVDGVLDQVDEAIGEGDVRLQPWMPRSEVEYGREAVQTAEGSWQVDAQLAAGRMVFIVEGQLGFLDVRQHAGARAVVVGAAVGQGQAPGGAFEQAHLQAFLQARDALAHGGTGEVHAFGGGDEAASVGHADEEVDVLEAFRGRHGEVFY